MARESADAKANRYFAEDRITVVAGSEHGIRLSIRGSRRDPYTVRLGRWQGRLIQDCDCDNPKPTCSHLKAAHRLWKE